MVAGQRGTLGVQSRALPGSVFRDRLSRSEQTEYACLRVTISSFDDLVAAARAEPVPQRLLFVFVQTKMQKDYDEAERAGFERGEGGALEPRFCVDLPIEELTTLAALVQEADRMDAEWDKMLIGCMNDVNDAATRADTELRAMVARIESGGDLRRYACFDREGHAIQFV